MTVTIFYKNLLSYFIILVPNVLVYFMSRLKPIEKNTGSKIPFRPPPYVFALVWPILLLLLGFSWYQSLSQGYVINTGYILLTFLLSIWSTMYLYHKVWGLLNITASWIVTSYLILSRISTSSSVLLVPLNLWLIYAAVLNYYSFRIEDKKRFKII